MAQLSYPAIANGSAIANAPGGYALAASASPIAERGLRTGSIALFGFGRVRATVTVDGTPPLPVSRRVRLQRRRDGLPVAEQWSDPVTGTYDFQYVQVDETYTTVALDHTGVFADIATGPIAPEPMP